MKTFILMAVVAGLAVLPGIAKDKKKKTAPKVEPHVIMTIPLGASPGKTTKLTLRGVGLDTATEVKVVGDNGTAKILSKGKAGAPDKNPNKVGDTQVEIELKLTNNLPGDTVMLFVVAANGTTKPRALLIGPASAEKEPNDGFRSAQLVTVPCAIAGTIGRAKDVDMYRFEGKKGQKLQAEVLASRHGSPLDAILTLYDARGEQLAANDDFSKDHHDPRIEAVLPADGSYFLSLIDAHDTGSNLHVYRLHVK